MPSPDHARHPAGLYRTRVFPAPVGFLKQAFPLLFSAPAGAQDAGR